jgi:hypothetical protein
MMRKILTALGMIAGLATAGAALADPPIGSRVGDRLRKSAEVVPEDKAALRAHAMAACLVNKRRPAIARLLAATDMPSLQAGFKTMWSGELTCQSGFEDNDSGFVEARRVQYPPDIMRGMLAEQMLRSLRSQVAALPAMPLLQQPYRRAWFGGSSRNAVIDEMATCMAETTPAGISELLATEPYSPGEKTTFGAITPMIGKCLSAGAKLVGNRQSVRAALADALYQRVVNPEPAAAPAAAPSPQGTTK